MFGIPQWHLYLEDLGGWNGLGPHLSKYARTPFAGYRLAGRSILGEKQGVLKV